MDQYKNIIAGLMIVCSVLLSACGHMDEQKTDETHKVETPEASPDEIVLTDAQIKAVNIELGTIETTKPSKRSSRKWSACSTATKQGRR